MKFAIGAMSVGDVLDRGLKLLLARLPTFFLIYLTAISPLIIFLILQPFLLEGSGSAPALGLAIGGLVTIGLSVVLSQIATAATLHVILEEFVDRPVTVGQALSFALQRFAPLLGTSILAGLIIMVGFMLCIAPGVYFAVSYIFASQIVVQEGLSGTPALTRSKNLIADHRGRVFGVILLVYIASFLIQMGLAYGLNTVLPEQEVIPTASGFEMRTKAINHVIDVLVTQLVGIIFGTYMAICSTLLYLDLRIRKEGLDLEIAAERQHEATDGPPPPDKFRPV